jgi:RimJ/RimL family protein N-acetyltransferase
MAEPDVSFRPLRREDVPLVHAWRQRAHVRRWWSSVETLEDAERKYLPRIEGREPTDVYLIVADDRPIGMIQTYMVDDYPSGWPIELEPGVAGVDLFIGEPELIGRGLGTEVIQAFVREIVFANPEATACVADPDVRNLASIRAFEKAGFLPLAIVQVPGEEAPQQLLRVAR